MRRVVVTTSTIAILLVTSTAPASFAAATASTKTSSVQPATTKSIQTDVASAVTWMAKNGQKSLPFWTGVAQFAGTGKFTTETWTKADLSGLKTSTDYAKAILGVLASGQDPHQVAGVNLVAKLAATQLTSGANSGKFTDNLDRTGTDLINNQAWAIIALEDAGGATYNRTTAAMWLIAHQNKDGGFGYSATYSSSDPDDTAAALVALNLLGFAKDSQVVHTGLTYLQSQQANDGGLVNGSTTSNSDSTGVTVDALVSYGIKPSAWQAKSGTPITSLLSEYDSASGGFKYDNTGGEFSGVSAMTTRDAIFGLSAVQSGQSVYQRLQATPLNTLNPYWEKIYVAGGAWFNHQWRTWTELRTMALAGSYDSALTPTWQKVVAKHGMYVTVQGKKVWESWDSKLAANALRASFGLDTMHINLLG